MVGVRVLVVDDEPMVLEVLARYLAKDGFEVTTADDGPSGLHAALESDPDLVVLDLMLPGIDGYEVFTRLREHSHVPVIMLTARGEVTDRIVGLDMGADDYIAKPFSPREVVSRIRTVLRRAGEARAAANPSTLRSGDLHIDLAGRAVHLRGEPVHLTPTEFDLLSYLAARPGVAIPRDELLAEVWDWAWNGDPSTVTVHIRRLREKVEDDPADPRRLITIWGVGYRFEALP